jgi:hypothetical protein
MALESGHVVKPTNGWYSRVNTETGEVEAKKWRIKDTDSAEFWTDIVESDTFKSWIESNYQFSSNIMGTEAEIELVSDEDL